MRRFLFGLIILVAILLGVLYVAPSLIPNEVYREQVQSAARQAIGRDVIIDGPVSVSVLPRLQARASQVRILNAEGFSEANFAEVEELRASLSLIPLLSRQVQVNEFVLERPRITLEVLDNGRVNWMFASADAPETARAVSGSGGDFRRGPGALPISALSLGDVRINDGAIRYIDRAAGRDHAFDDVNLALSLPSLSEPLTLDGGLTFDGEPMSLALRLDSLRTFFEGGEAPITLAFESALATADVDGRFLPGAAPAYEGAFAAAIPSLPRLAALAGAALPEGDVFQSVSVSGAAEGGFDAMSFRDARLEFDDIVGTGEVTYDLTGNRPFMGGTLDIRELDMNPYLPPESGAGSSGGSGVPPWSEAPIDLSPLSMLDAAFELTVGTLQFGDITFRNATLDAELENGRLEAALTQVQGFGGAGDVTLIANARNARPSFTLAGALSDVQALELLTQAAGFDRLSGTGSLSFDLRTSGASQAEIMRRLSGDADFTFADGAITGVDLGRIARAGRDLLTGGVGGLASAWSSRESTDFSELSATFTVADGVARTNDIAMLSPLLRVRGDGEISFAGQSLDLTLRPSVVASAEGQGGVADLDGLEVPVRLYGPWASPEQEILVGEVRDSVTAIRVGTNEDGTARTVGDEAARLIDENIGGEAGAAIQNILGVRGSRDDEADAAEEDEPSQEDAVRDLLQGVLGGGDDGR